MSDGSSRALWSGGSDWSDLSHGPSLSQVADVTFGTLNPWLPSLTIFTRFSFRTSDASKPRVARWPFFPLDSRVTSDPLLALSTHVALFTLGTIRASRTSLSF